jgi:hypothetical protein
MIFDATNKGYIIEDDCMEILYGRYGGYRITLTWTTERGPNLSYCAHRGNLEKEMKLLFGKKLRAEGGDGTLSLEA